MNRLLFVILFMSILSCSNQTPEIELCNLFADHMVLQQKTHAPIWGKSSPGVIVNIEASWGENVKVRTDKEGKWRIDLKTPEYGGPYSLTIKARKSIVVIEDVLIGEVWLCSGQSNMEMPLKGWPPEDTINYSESEINQANFSGIRMFTVGKTVSFTPLDSCGGNWQVCSPETAGGFSATAYFFGRHLHNQLNIPVGLIHSSWGGTPAESWTAVNYLEDVPGYEGIVNDVSDAQVKQVKFSEWLIDVEKIDIGGWSFDSPFDKLELNDSVLMSPDYDDSNWKTMELPGLWEQKGLSSFDGIVWYRKQFDYQDNVYPESIKIYLGPIDDMDVVYVNGVKVGGIEVGGFWKKERLYDIPSGVLRKGKNTVAVRVIDPRGGGGIEGGKNLAIVKGQKEIVNLSGEWKYKPIAMFYNNNLYRFSEGEKDFEKAPRPAFNLDAHAPTALYQAMIAPLIPYSIKGAIWYQGESNVGRGVQYRKLFPAMINSWRDNWQIGDFPFYYVQIAPYNYQDNGSGATPLLREAQFLTLKEENVGMVVTTDIGNLENIHPGNKQEVGRRLALLALANDYGQEETECSGPIFESAKFEKDKAIVKFSSIGGGLVCKGDELTDFEVAEEDKVYYDAIATIEGNTVVVTSDSVMLPKYVRFGWSDIAEPNLFNKEGLPASPFRSSVE
jgi:sialate O-acetylesterase